MPTAQHFLLGAVPGLLWLIWFFRKDDHEPEPKRLVALAFLAGAAAAFLVVGLRPHVEGFVLDATGAGFSSLIDAFLVTAPLEEVVKTVALLSAVGWSREWDEPLDGIVYGAAVALGFASVENAYYAAASGGAGVIVARAFTSTLAHCAFTGGCGLILGLGRFRGGRVFALALPFGFLIAILAHGTFDWLLLSGGRDLFALLGWLPLMIVVLALELRWARSISPRYHPRPAVP